MLFISSASCVLYSAGSGVKRANVVFSGLRMRCFVSMYAFHVGIIECLLLLCFCQCLLMLSAFDVSFTGDYGVGNIWCTRPSLYRMMYWSDWGASPKIMSCVMDGTQCHLMVWEDIEWPNGLVIDFTTDRLFWVDAKLDQASSVKLDGTDRRVRYLKYDVVMVSFGHVLTLVYFITRLIWKWIQLIHISCRYLKMNYIGPIGTCPG